MPHISMEYSANLEEEVDIQALCECLRAAAVEVEAFPMAGIRVRAFAARHYSIADGDPKHGFIDISIRLRGGRTDSIKKAATDHLFQAVCTFLNDVLDRRSLAISMEMRDIDPELSPKTGTIRKHLGDA